MPAAAPPGADVDEDEGGGGTTTLEPVLSLSVPSVTTVSPAARPDTTTVSAVLAVPVLIGRTVTVLSEPTR